MYIVLYTHTPVPLYKLGQHHNSWAFLSHTIQHASFFQTLMYSLDLVCAFSFKLAYLYRPLHQEHPSISLPCASSKRWSRRWFGTALFLTTTAWYHCLSVRRSPLRGYTVHGSKVLEHVVSNIDVLTRVSSQSTVQQEHSVADLEKKKRGFTSLKWGWGCSPYRHPEPTISFAVLRAIHIDTAMRIKCASNPVWAFTWIRLEIWCEVMRIHHLEIVSTQYIRLVSYLTIPGQFPPERKDSCGPVECEPLFQQCRTWVQDRFLKALISNPTMTHSPLPTCMAHLRATSDLTTE